VPIGRGLRNSASADVAAGAGLVVDDDRLAERLRKGFGDITRDQVR
jgi:hypothetical protein